MAEKKNPGGRPRKNKPKFTKQAVSTILSYISIGSHVETAALAAGISRESLHEWIRNANKAETKLSNGDSLDAHEKAFLKFREDLNTAVAKSELLDLGRIDRAGDSIWQAAAWKLERRYADRWALKNRTTNENINVDLGSLSNEQLLRLHNGEPLSSVLSQPVPEPTA